MIDCIFCKIIKGESPSKKVTEDEWGVVFHDISPKAPVHVLAVPKKHTVSMIDLRINDWEMPGKLMILASKAAEKLGLNKGGYKAIINNGKRAGQLVDHLHIHILGGWKTQDNDWKV